MKTMEFIEKTSVKFRLTRDLKKSDIEGLDRDLKKGEILFEYPLYVSSTPSGMIAVCEHDGESPYYEIPKDALVKI